MSQQSNLNDQKIALEWIRSIEGDGAKIREQDIYPLLNEWILEHQPTTILELGCGQGICSSKIDLSQRNYIGLELSPLLVDRAKELYPADNKKFILGSLYEIPLENNSIEAAYSVSVIHLLSDLKKATSELNRVLKKGAHFFMITANPDAYPLWTGLYKESRQEGIRFDGKFELKDGSFLEETLYLYSLREIEDAFRSQNLMIQASSTFRVTDKSKGLAQYLLIKGQCL